MDESSDSTVLLKVVLHFGKWSTDFGTRFSLEKCSVSMQKSAAEFTVCENKEIVFRHPFKKHRKSKFIDDYPKCKKAYY